MTRRSWSRKTGAQNLKSTLVVQTICWSSGRWSCNDYGDDDWDNADDNYDDDDDEDNYFYDDNGVNIKDNDYEWKGMVIVHGKYSLFCSIIGGQAIFWGC